jgi:hypothetical protein
MQSADLRADCQRLPPTLSATRPVSDVCHRRKRQLDRQTRPNFFQKPLRCLRNLHTDGAARRRYRVAINIRVLLEVVLGLGMSARVIIKLLSRERAFRQLSLNELKSARLAGALQLLHFCHQNGATGKSNDLFRLITTATAY